MKREPVQSSNLKSVGYDVDTQILEIEFHDGRIYQYSDVPEYEYERLMTARSHGKYFAKEIKKYPGRYPYVRVK